MYREGQENGLPIGKPNAPEDLFQDHHLTEPGFFRSVSHPGHGEVAYPGGPVYLPLVFRDDALSGAAPWRRRSRQRLPGFQAINVGTEMFLDRTAIAGIKRTEFSKDSGRSELTLAYEVSRAAIADAGLSIGDIDGVGHCDMDRMSPSAIVRALGLYNLAFVSELGAGGAAPCGMVGLAAMTVISGQPSVVLVYRAPNGRSESRFGAAIAPRPVAGGRGNYDEFFTPYGLLTASQSFALLVQRHVIEFGIDAEALGAVVLTCRASANRTPQAQMHGKGLTFNEYLGLRMIDSVALVRLLSRDRRRLRGHRHEPGTRPRSAQFARSHPRRRAGRPR